VEALARRLAAIEADAGPDPGPNHASGPPRAVSTGVASLDATLAGGLRAGAVHEWAGHDMGEGDRPSASGWSPPVGILVWLARRALASAPGRRAVWIGRAVTPYPAALAGRVDAGGPRLIERSLLVDASSAGERVWAADLALRCRAVGCVALDGRGLDLACTRRLQLAARAGGGIALVARPASMARVPTAAATRWATRPWVGDEPEPAACAGPRWTVELLRCKGVQPAPEAPRRWVVEWCCETSDVRVDAGVVDRSRPPAVGSSPAGGPGPGLRLTG
jgi:protein ImuA